eukprot:7949-Heterococcus_DN1.PRE.7
MKRLSFPYSTRRHECRTAVAAGVAAAGLLKRSTFVRQGYTELCTVLYCGSRLLKALEHSRLCQGADV